MQVSLDGGSTWQPARHGVRVIYYDRELPNETAAELHINMTGEGVIFDVWADDVNSADLANAGTSSETVDEIISRLVRPGEESQHADKVQDG